MTTKTGAQWIKTRDRTTGRPLAVAIPSASQPGKYHLVTRRTCDCLGFQHRGRCRHHDALLAELRAQDETVLAAAEAARGEPIHVPLVARLMA